jgi:hypothetical protein
MYNYHTPPIEEIMQIYHISTSNYSYILTLLISLPLLNYILMEYDLFALYSIKIIIFASHSLNNIDSDLMSDYVNILTLTNATMDKINSNITHLHI